MFPQKNFSKLLSFHIDFIPSNCKVIQLLIRRVFHDHLIEAAYDVQKPTDKFRETQSKR